MVIPIRPMTTGDDRQAFTTIRQIRGRSFIYILYEIIHAKTCSVNLKLHDPMEAEKSYII